MSRLSMGLSDALHWLGARGSLSAAGTAVAAAAEEGMEEGAKDRLSLAAAGPALPLGGSQLSPILASPAGEGEGGATEQESTALQQQEQQQRQGLGRGRPGVSPIPESPPEEEGSPSSAEQPSPSRTEEDADVQQPEAEQGPAGVAAGQVGEMAEQEEAAVDGLRAQLEQKLSLVEERGVEESKNAAPAVRITAAATAAAHSEAAAAGTAAAPLAVLPAEEEEELSPLQQLLALCAQEVSSAAHILPMFLPPQPEVPQLQLTHHLVTPSLAAGNPAGLSDGAAHNGRPAGTACGPESGQSTRGGVMCLQVV